MAKRYDSRNFGYKRAGAEFAAFATAARATPLEGSHTIAPERVNPFTGSVDVLRSTNAGASAFAAGLPPSDGALIDRAVAHLENVTVALGFAADSPVEFVPDPHVKSLSSGYRVVNAKQYYRGVPVFQMERTVTFDRLGAILTVTGTSVSLSPDLELLPSIPVEQAVLVAADAVCQPDQAKNSWSKTIEDEPKVDPKGYKPVRLAGFEFPSQPVVLDQGPFAEPIPAHLVLFYAGPTTRLAWQFLITMPGLVAQYLVLVEADSQANAKEVKLLYLAATHSQQAKFSGSVFTFNPAHGARQTVVFPRPLSDYPVNPIPAGLPHDFPHPWCDDTPPFQTVGNNTIAVKGETTTSLAGQAAGGAVIFQPTQDQGDDQKILNIFYFCNYMHDFFYLLGFTEAAGNFQKDNLTGGGIAGDPVIARAHPGPVGGTANMLTRADGISAVMNMGLVAGTGRHTAFDSDVVMHEFTHGVTNRLVGGMRNARALQMPQSVGMGEGWSDYFALTIQNYFLPTERTVTGDWVINNPTGIRLAPYDENYPAGFDNVGRPPYDEDEHAIGEIWCATLMQMNRNLGAGLGSRERGHNLGWAIVVDGLKLTPADPSFLDARDAILQALEGKVASGELTAAEFKVCRRAAWKAFSRFGLGPKARSVGASLEDGVGDTSMPTGI